MVKHWWWEIKLCIRNSWCRVVVFSPFSSHSALVEVSNVQNAAKLFQLTFVWHTKLQRVGAAKTSNDAKGSFCISFIYFHLCSLRETWITTQHWWKPPTGPSWSAFWGFSSRGVFRRSVKIVAVRTSTQEMVREFGKGSLPLLMFRMNRSTVAVFQIEFMETSGFHRNGTWTTTTNQPSSEVVFLYRGSCEIYCVKSSVCETKLQPISPNKPQAIDTCRSLAIRRHCNPGIKGWLKMYNWYQMIAYQNQRLRMLHQSRLWTDAVVDLGAATPKWCLDIMRHVRFRKENTAANP